MAVLDTILHYSMFQSLVGSTEAFTTLFPTHGASKSKGG